MLKNDLITTIKQFESLRRSGTLPRASQARADEISRHLTLANKQGGERYFATVARARNFIDLAAELGLDQ